MRWEYDGFETSGLHRFKDGSGNLVRVRAIAKANRLDLREVVVSGEDVTSDVLRSVRIGEIRREIHAKLTAGGVGVDPLADGWAVLARLYRAADVEVPSHLAEAEAAVETAVASLKTEHSGRRTMNDDHFRRIALAYIAAFAIDQRRPIAIMATEFGYSHNTIAGWVSRARRAGWLAETRPGRPGGAPGPELLAWEESRERGKK